MRASDHSGNSVSPCSPTIWAWTEVGATPVRRAISQRRREVSSTVPEANTRSGGSPEASWASMVRTSQGLVTMTMIACGATSRTSRTIEPTIFALVAASSMRV